MQLCRTSLAPLVPRVIAVVGHQCDLQPRKRAHIIRRSCFVSIDPLPLFLRSAQRVARCGHRPGGYLWHPGTYSLGLLPLLETLLPLDRPSLARPCSSLPSPRLPQPFRFPQFAIHFLLKWLGKTLAGPVRWETYGRAGIVLTISERQEIKPVVLV